MYSNIKKISILIPAYNEEASLPLLYPQLKDLMDSMKQYDWEVLFINDGSKDKTLEIIKDLRNQDMRICYVDLSRNFGKENAMLAGFDYVTGDCMIIMDADLQHPPQLIKEMLIYWEEGYDDVYAKRLCRGKESWLRKKLSLLYYQILNIITGIDILQNVGDFRLLDRKCINALKLLREKERYTKGLYSWIGFRKKEIKFEQKDRIAGKTSWNYFSLFKLAMNGIISFTNFPLRIATLLGIIIFIIAFIYMIYVLIKTLMYGDSVAGFPTLICVILFLGGIQLFCIGIIGEYVARIFNESKGRPVYIAKEYNNQRI